MWRLALALGVAVSAAGCIFGPVHIEELGPWPQPGLFGSVPAAGTYDGLVVEDILVPHPNRGEPEGLTLYLPFNSTRLDERYGPDNYALMRAEQGSLWVSVSSMGWERHDGTEEFIHPEVTVYYFSEAPTTLERARAVFTAFVQNVCEVSKPEADAWAEDVFPESERSKLEDTRPRQASYEYVTGSKARAPLRLDALFAETQPQETVEPGSSGFSPRYAADGWGFEFKLREKTIRVEAFSGSTYLRVDANDEAFFQRRGAAPVGEEEVRADLSDLLARLGIETDTAGAGPYEHSTYRD